jgi:hypothetical protein
MVTLNNHKEKDMTKPNKQFVSYLNRAMRTLRRRILAMATKIIAKTKAIFEYVSVPTTQRFVKNFLY